ncbi:uncharacterized protein FFB20_15436 [Fusarium fujikuroi]|nr:uncharacterized protein FFB20_15436 [Fusarium fujikuroi]
MVIKSLPKGAHFERFNLNRPVVQARKNGRWGDYLVPKQLLTEIPQACGKERIIRNFLLTRPKFFLILRGLEGPKPLCLWHTSIGSGRSLASDLAN